MAKDLTDYEFLSWASRFLEQAYLQEQSGPAEGRVLKGEVFDLVVDLVRRHVDLLNRHEALKVSWRAFVDNDKGGKP